MHGHVQDIGDRLCFRFTGRDLRPFCLVASARRQQGDIEYLAAEPVPVAVRTTQVDVTQELHFDVLKTVAAACWAAPVSGVETERAGSVATFACQWFGAKPLADSVKRADVTRRGGTRRFTDGGLIDE